MIGAGSFGTALALHLGRKGKEVLLLSHRKDIVEGINNTKKNPVYLTSTELPANVRGGEFSAHADLRPFAAVVIAVPTQYIAEVISQFKIAKDTLLVCASKGIEIATGALPSDIIARVFGDEISRKTVFLSGPSFAGEVALEMPTALSAACYDVSMAEKAQTLFHSPYFRIYTSLDPIGIQVAGAVKNVIAIASGACNGLGFGANSRAALITRGLAEMTRLGIALGAQPSSFIGLGGVGDLFLTCSSEQSRNFSFGLRLARGESAEDIMSGMDSVAEGVTTAKAAHFLGLKLGVSLPITSLVYEVLYESKPVKQAVLELISREPKPEESF